MKIADKIVGNILGSPRSRGGKNDWDGDGVRNKKDCQPRNTMRQDAVQTIMTEVSGVPPNGSRRERIGSHNGGVGSQYDTNMKNRYAEMGWTQLKSREVSAMVQTKSYGY